METTISDTAVLALIAALILKFTDFAKHLRARDWSSVVTQLLAWGAAFLAIVLFAHSGYASRAVVSGIHLDKASWADQLLLGLIVGSGGSVIYDFKRAIDTSDSAAMPPLLPAAHRRHRTVKHTK